MKKSIHILVTLAGAALTGGGLYLAKTVQDPIGIMKTLPYLCIGIGCGAFGHGLGELVRIWAVSKDPAQARQMEIDATDERNVMLANRAKAKGYDMMTYVFAALMLAYALMGASFEIILPFVAAYLFVHGVAAYHRLKGEKEG